LQSFNDVFFFNMLQPHDENTEINEPHVEDDLSDTSDQDPVDNTTWILLEKLYNFLTKIYKDNLLPKYTKTQILKNQLHNADIIYDALAMNKHL
ncbi:6299_t:CDS:1, partial [Racocetra persica]